MSKTILITGASSGIGKATAAYFKERGWNVVATMRTPEKETVLTTQNNVLVTTLDVQKPETITNAVAEAIEAFGAIDVLVNNAGYGAFGVLEATPMEKIRRQFEVNVFGLIETTKAIIPHFRARKSGMIINISSIGGKMTFPLGAPYHSSKFAVEGLSEALSFEMEAIGVVVKIVEPGAVRTYFGGRSLDFTNDESLAEYQNTVAKLVAGFEATTHASEPSVVAEVIFQAATDGSKTMRYTAGEDAKEIMAHRKKLDDESFRQGIKDRFKL